MQDLLPAVQEANKTVVKNQIEKSS